MQTCTAKTAMTLAAVTLETISLVVAAKAMGIATARAGTMMVPIERI